MGAAPRVRAGFSLTELLVVIGIIVLFIGIAIPAFNLITGRRSIAGAQNLVSAEVASVRMRAIAQQARMGLLFTTDVNERVSLRRVEVVERVDGDVIIDLAPDSEPVVLPAGISMQFLRAPGAGSVGRYAGFSDGTTPPGRVMLFGPSGRVELTRFWYRAADNGGAQTQLGQLLGITSNLPPGGRGLAPEVGFVLFDRSTFTGQFDLADTGGEADEEDWLDENGTLLVLSRYNGTFVQEGK